MPRGLWLWGDTATAASANAEVEFCDQDNKGYALLTLTPQEARAEHVVVSTVLARDFTSRVSATHRTGPGQSGGPLRAA